MKLRVWVAVIASGLLSAACDDNGSAATDGPKATLAEWGIFADVATQTPNEGFVPFEVNTPLFSDYALKHRFISVPAGGTVTYDATGAWSLPVGSIVVKTFSLPVDARDPSLGEQLLETRILHREADGWTPHTYVYGADGVTATRKVAGAVLDVAWLDANGTTRSNNYVVPNNNECTECHGEAPDTDLLGVKTAQLNRMNTYGGVAKSQIDHLASVFGMAGVPAAGQRLAFPDPAGDAPLTDRVRGYLDVNCSHCHGRATDVSKKQLFLDWPSTDPAGGNPSDWGVCKVPTSAGGATCGRIYDVVPGDPDASIITCRLESDEAKVQMPPLGRALVHTEGAALIRRWIAEMDPVDCAQAPAAL